MKVYRATLRGYVFVAFDAPHDAHVTPLEAAQAAAAKVEAGELTPAWRVVAVDDQGTGWEDDYEEWANGVGYAKNDDGSYMTPEQTDQGWAVQ